MVSMVSLVLKEPSLEEILSNSERTLRKENSVDDLFELETFVSRKSPVL